MSYANFEVHILFSSSELRDKAIEFLNDEGPTFEDEVEEPFRHLFPLQDDIEQPAEIEPVGDTGLYAAFFDVFGADGFYQAQDYMEIFFQVGAVKVYGFFEDDGDTQAGWTMKDGNLLTFYTGYEDDEETAESLLDIDDKDRLPKLIELYETGKLEVKEM